MIIKSGRLVLNFALHMSSPLIDGYCLVQRGFQSICQRPWQVTSCGLSSRVLVFSSASSSLSLPCLPPIKPFQHQDHFSAEFSRSKLRQVNRWTTCRQPEPFVNDILQVHWTPLFLKTSNTSLTNMTSRRVLPLPLLQPPHCKLGLIAISHAKSLYA